MGHLFVQALEEIVTDDPDEVVAELVIDKIPSLALLDDAAHQIEVIREKLAAA